MVTLLIVVGLIGGTCALIYGMVMLAMMFGKKSKRADAQKVVLPPSSIKRAHTAP